MAQPVNGPGRPQAKSIVNRQSLLFIPMGLVAVALGYAAQGLSSRPSEQLQGALMASLIATPPPATDTRMAAQQLKQLQAERSGEGLAEPRAGTPVALEVRVALLGAGESPSLSATGPWQLVSRDGVLLQRGDAGQLVHGAGLWHQRSEAWLQTSGAAILVNGRPYAGRLRLVIEGGQLTLVNHLPLETYVASVVGSEMPSSWAIEALKAQAVAARSYALAHMARPANRHWHLGDNTRWQAYRGLETSNPRTREAVAKTSGLILSYQGAIVESLYAATREISLEAHGSLGASMSQHGAQELAQQGMTYNAILGHYYQGASLARLRSGAS
jgi:hypothetical protein